MAVLRKMLGDVNSNEYRALMELIATRSQKTLDSWAIGYAAERYLPIFERECPGEEILARTVDRRREYITGSMKLREPKPFLAEARRYAGSVKGNAAQAAARAVATACAVVQTPTNAFGFLMYGAAAVAYSLAGLDKDIAEYESMATREMIEAFESLKTVAAADEPNPAKINWNC